MKISQNKKEMFQQLLKGLSDTLANNGCNDVAVANTLELYQLLSQDDYEPSISKDRTKLYTHDFVILDLISEELGLRNNAI